MKRSASFIIFLLCLFTFIGKAQDSQLQTQLKVRQLVEKKAEYHRLNGGEQDGYRIKIFFGIDREQGQTVKNKFSAKYNEYSTYEEYQQPNFVILVGDFKTKLEAYQYLKKIQPDYPNGFIVKDKVRLK
jgi:hypothetical protein